jgi:general stress protein 26
MTSEALDTAGLGERLPDEFAPSPTSSLMIPCREQDGRRPARMTRPAKKEQEMSEPATSLDTRFSEPGSAATPWETTLEVLKAAELSWISTVRHDGRPHVSPLVTVWFDQALWFATGGAEQKAVNLRTNRHVVVTTGCNSWDRGLDVVVEGEATRETDDAVLAQLAKAWSAKWDGRWQYEVRDGAFHHPGGEEEVLVFRITPRKILAFGKGTFTHTSHRFATPTASTHT